MPGVLLSGISVVVTGTRNLLWRFLGPSRPNSHHTSVASEVFRFMVLARSDLRNNLSLDPTYLCCKVDRASSRLHLSVSSFDIVKSRPLGFRFLVWSPPNDSDLFGISTELIRVVIVSRADFRFLNFVNSASHLSKIDAFLILFYQFYT